MTQLVILHDPSISYYFVILRQGTEILRLHDFPCGNDGNDMALGQAMEWAGQFCRMMKFGLGCVIPLEEHTF